MKTDQAVQVERRNFKAAQVAQKAEYAINRRFCEQGDTRRLKKSPKFTPMSLFFGNKKCQGLNVIMVSRNCRPLLRAPQEPAPFRAFTELKFLDRRRDASNQCWLDLNR